MRHTSVKSNSTALFGVRKTVIVKASANKVAETRKQFAEEERKKFRSKQAARAGRVITSTVQKAEAANCVKPKVTFGAVETLALPAADSERNQSFEADPDALASILAGRGIDLNHAAVQAQPSQLVGRPMSGILKRASLVLGRPSAPQRHSAYVKTPTARAPLFGQVAFGAYSTAKKADAALLRRQSLLVPTTSIRKQLTSRLSFRNELTEPIAKLSLDESTVCSPPTVRAKAASPDRRTTKQLIDFYEAMSPASLQLEHEQSRRRHDAILECMARKGLPPPLPGAGPPSPCPKPSERLSMIQEEAVATPDVPTESAEDVTLVSPSAAVLPAVVQFGGADDSPYINSIQAKTTTQRPNIHRRTPPRADAHGDSGRATAAQSAPRKATVWMASGATPTLEATVEPAPSRRRRSAFQSTGAVRGAASVDITALSATLTDPLIGEPSALDSGDESAVFVPVFGSIDSPLENCLMTPMPRGRRKAVRRSQSPDAFALADANSVRVAAPMKTPLFLRSQSRAAARKATRKHGTPVDDSTADEWLSSSRVPLMQLNVGNDETLRNSTALQPADSCCLPPLNLSPIVGARSAAAAVEMRSMGDRLLDDEVTRSVSAVASHPSPFVRPVDPVATCLRRGDIVTFMPIK